MARLRLGAGPDNAAILDRLARIYRFIPRGAWDAQGALGTLLTELSPCPICQGEGWVNPTDPENCPHCERGFYVPEEV